MHAQEQYKQEDRQAHREIDRQTEIETDRQTDRETRDKLPVTHKQIKSRMLQ